MAPISNSVITTQRLTDQAPGWPNTGTVIASAAIITNAGCVALNASRTTILCVNLPLRIASMMAHQNDRPRWIFDVAAMISLSFSHNLFIPIAIDVSGEAFSMGRALPAVHAFSTMLHQSISQTCSRLIQAYSSVWQSVQHLAHRINQSAEEPNPFLDDRLFPEDPTNIDDAYLILNIDRNSSKEAFIARRDYLVNFIRRKTSRASPLLKQGFERFIQEINIACETVLASKR